jgi:hypothetical protein
MADVKQNNYVENGYHGGMLVEFPIDKLQKCGTNEIDKDFKLEVKASLKSDVPVINHEIAQSFGPALYNLDNMYNCDCDLKNVNNVLLSQPGIYISGVGKGWTGHNGCEVDKDSSARFSELTDKRYIRQLPQLKNNGFFGKGPHDVDTESIIQSSNLTALQKPCGPLSGSSTLPYSITPMIKQLQSEVQDTKHIIPEDTMNSWIRGGLPSRQIARNADYLDRCQQKVEKQQQLK